MSGEGRSRLLQKEGNNILQKWFCSTLLMGLVGAIVFIIYRQTYENNMISQYYRVVHDWSSEKITLDPLGYHENTLIWLGDLGIDNTAYFKQFAIDKLAPLNSRIVLPEAPIVKGKDGGFYKSWFDLNTNQT